MVRSSGGLDAAITPVSLGQGNGRFRPVGWTGAEGFSAARRPVHRAPAYRAGLIGATAHPQWIHLAGRQRARQRIQAGPEQGSRASLGKASMSYGGVAGSRMG